MNKIDIPTKRQKLLKKKNQKEILHLKTTVTEKFARGVNSRMRQAEERTCKLEQKSFKIIKSEK